MLHSQLIQKLEKQFQSQRAQILERQKLRQSALNIAEDALSDETDLCSLEMQRSLEIRLAKRDQLYLEKIQSALNRIRSGGFGKCVDCGSGIDEKRLMARPTGTLCIGCKENQERTEFSFGRSKKALRVV